MERELNIRDIAGFCPEEAVWKMIADVSEVLLTDGAVYVLSPESIGVVGNSFIVESNEQPEDEFMAPEQEGNQASMRTQMVWTLGAIAYYMATGHVVFGGHGGKYQKDHPSVSLPVLPKVQQALTPVLHRCLCEAPDGRISMDELNIVAKQGLKSCSCRQRERLQSVQSDNYSQKKYQGEKWPEEMVEI